MKTETKNLVRSISIEKLIAHPDNPNRMSKANFARLVRNIKRSGRYEPIVVRPHPAKAGCFQIINGHHRCDALAELGYKKVDVVVWDIDDEQADILLGTLNRLCGSDELSKKLKLLNRLNRKMESERLARLLPYTRKHIERLANLKRPAAPAPMSFCRKTEVGANPMVFFVNDVQQQTIDSALSLAQGSEGQAAKAKKNAAALTAIAKHFIEYMSG